MAMGASTQGTPFKPCYAPVFWYSPLFRRSTSTAASSYRAFSPSSAKGLERQEIQSLQGPSDPCSAIYNSGSLKLRQDSVLAIRSFTMKDGRGIIGDAGYSCGPSQPFNFKMRVDLRNSPASFGRMLSYHSNSTISQGRECSVPLADWKKENARSDAFPPCRAGGYYVPASKTEWLEVIEKVKESKSLQQVRHNIATGMTVDIPLDGTVVKEKIEFENLQDEDANKSSGFSKTSFRNQRFDSIAEKSEMQTSYNEKNVAYDMENPQSVAEREFHGMDTKSNGNGKELPIKGGNKETLSNCLPLRKVDTRSNSPPICADNVHERLNRIYDKVLIVDNISMAKKVVEMLTVRYRHLIHACDTEVSKIDVKQETPVGHGEIICFSVYSGSEADFDGKSCIWVDVLDGGRDLLKEFAPFFEDPSIKKVWHNYSFDSHVIENYGLKVAGFHADTMHLARLYDSSRRTEGGYSLEALTSDPGVMSSAPPCTEGDLISGKISMKSIFGRKKLKKDGSEGKLITVAPVEELQRKERIEWICYSALDSMSTLRLFESLRVKLMAMEWVLDGVARGSMYDFYEEYWRPFGELLVKMESEGMLVDRAYLSEMEKVATKEQQVAADKFRKWASRYCPDAEYMNVGSDAQLRQLFFGGIINRKNPDESLPQAREFKVPNVDKVIEEGKKVPTKFRNIKLHCLGKEMQAEIYTATGWPSVSGDALKGLAGKVSADMYEFQSDDSHETSSDLPSDEADETGTSTPSVNGVDTSVYGTAFHAFGGDKEGMEACHSIAALCEVCSIDSLISNFILPLQGNHISGKNGRVHCSLNINTETGRLSARRPNLQNQPALEKDRYKIRQAFIAEPRNSLIVADYGQLELRILAHLANCKSMLDAFRAGGDFHSRTAMNMYPHIREAVEKKRVLLEWYPQPGEEKPPVPLLKDAYASERRKAKMLNFSIAYGKTPVGLARDWKVSVKEAKKTVDLWYKERQEVLGWQEERKEEARQKHRVFTLLGRARRFPSLDYASYAQRAHIERAAINTPVQGSAADVAMCAMLEISRNTRLKELGWRLLLQVHDEVILEGPMDSAEDAKAVVIECMSKPFYGTNFLKVDLSVDAKCAQSWYAAK